MFGAEQKSDSYQGAERGVLGRLENDRAPNGKRRGNLPAEHHQRVCCVNRISGRNAKEAKMVPPTVPGHDLSNNPDRFVLGEASIERCVVS